MTVASFIPLRQLLATLEGSVAAGYGGDSVLDRIGISAYGLTGDAVATTASLTLAVDEEVGFTLPGSEDIGLFVGASGGLTEIDVVASVAVDGVTVRVGGLDAVIRFGALLRPARWTGEAWEPGDGAVEVPLAGVDLVVTPDGSVEVTAGGVPPVLSIPPTMVGETGVVVEAAGVELFLGAGGPRPPTAPPGFRGLHLTGVRVHLPDTLAGILPEGIAVDEAWIGAGGFTGSVTFAWDHDAPPGADPAGRLGGLGFELERVTLELTQNVPTASAIAGRLTVPFLDAAVDVEVSVGAGGTFGVAVSGADGGDLASVDLPGLGSVELDALAVMLGSGASGSPGATVTVSGALLPAIGAPAVDWPRIALDGLSIGSDGSVQLEGGWLDLSEPLALDLSGFRLELTRIGFGQDGEWRWVGLSGAVRLVELLPTGVSADGLRLHWTADGRTNLTLDGVGLTATLPGVATLTGAVAMHDDGLGGRRFDGALSLTLIALDVSVDATVVIGFNPATGTYFMASLAVELPVGIPLWASGAAIYGLGALVAIDMAPTVEAGDWYGWYAGAPAPFDVAAPHRWGPEAGAAAVGAGVVVGTVFDGGWAVSTKSVLAVAVPGPTIVISGTADVLKVRPGLGDGSEGTFGALAVLDGAAGTLLVTIDAGWKVPFLVDVSGSAGAFFDFTDISRWWVHLGERLPASARVRADLLTLFDADAYLVADRTGLALGASASLGDTWRFGPVRVTLYSWVEVAGAVSWQPIQLAGAVSLGGQYEISVAGIGLGIAAEATLAGSAPAPFAVEGTLHVVVKLPTPIPDLDETIRLAWTQPGVPALADPFAGVSLTHPLTSDTWTAATTDTGGPLVPLDCRPTVVFARSVRDDSGLGTASSHHPGPTAVGDYAIDHALTAVSLEQWARVDGAGGWVPAEVELSAVWQLVENEGGDLVDTRLVVWGDTPLDFTRSSSETYSTGLLGAHSEEPCGTPVAPDVVCVNAADWPLDRVFEGGLSTGLGDLLLPWPTRATTVPAAPGLGAAAFRIDTGQESGMEATLWVRPAEAFDRIAVLTRAVLGDVIVRVWRDGEVLAEEVLPAAQVRFIGLDVDAGQWLEMSGTRFDVAEICVLTHASNAGAIALEARRSALTRLTEQWGALRPVLRPQTRYRLTVQTSGTRTGGPDEAQESWTSHAYFQTGGPPGAPAPWDAVPAEGGGAATAFPTGGALATLAPYVEATVPEADAPAHYPAYDLGALLGSADVEAMFGGDLRVQVRDRNGRLVTGADGRPLLAWNAWGTRPTLGLASYQVQYAEAATSCLGVPVPPLPAPTLSLAPDLLLDLTFDDPSALSDLVAVLDVAGSSWQVRDGALHQDGSARPGALVSQARFTGGLAVEVDLTLTRGAVALVLGYVDDASHHRVVLDAGASQARLETVSASAVSRLWSGDVVLPLGVPFGLRAQVEGSRVRLLVDDALLLDGPLLPALAAEPPADTAVGIGTWGSVDVAVDRLRVTRWPGGVLATSSRYDVELVGACLLAQAAALDPLPPGWQQDGELTLVGLAQAWTDVRVQADLGADAGTGPVALVARHGPGGDHVRLVLHPATGRRTLVVHSGGAADELWADTGYHAGDVQSLTLEVVGDVAEVSVSGQRLATVGLGGAVPGPGLAGVQGAQDEGAHAENVTVWTAPRSVAHSWPLTTSSAPDLVHLLDTFTGTVYPEPVTPAAGFAAWVRHARDERQGDDDAQASARQAARAAAPLDLPAAAAAAREATDSRTAHAAALYAEGVGLLGLGHRARPPVVELSALAAASGAVQALLLELPEPLAWERVRVAGSLPGAGGPPVVVWNGDGTRALLLPPSGTRWPAGEYVLDLVLDLDVGPETPTWQRATSTRAEVGRLAFALPLAGA